MDDRKPYLVAVLIQVIYTVLYVVSKAAFNNGLSTFVFVFYRQAVGSVVLLPISILLEWRKSSPPLRLMTLIKVFLHALIGVTLSLDMYNVGLKYTSATVASACGNSLPALTFFLAVLLRVESINVRNLHGTVKVLGVALCLAGTLVIALYKGPYLEPLNHHHLFGQNAVQSVSSNTNWIKGAFLVVVSNFSWSLWLVLQGFLLKDIPAKLLLTTLECIFSAIQSFLVALAFERDISKWKLKLDTGLLVILYSVVIFFALSEMGVVVTGVCFYLQTWCVEKKGPVVLAMSTPLALVFTMICSSLFLGELIHLGSVLGGLLVVGGLYSVLWGKSKESAVRASKEPDGREQVTLENEAPIISSPNHHPV